MRFPDIHIARGRFRLGVLGAILLMGFFTPVKAASPPPDPIAQAQAEVQQAQGAATSADSALAQAQATLAASQAQLAALNQQIADLDGQIAAKTSVLITINKELDTDRNLLRNYMLQAYTRSQSGTLDYLLSSTSLVDALDRQANVKAFNAAGEDLIGRVNTEKKQADDALASLKSNREALAYNQQQVAAAEAVTANEEVVVANADKAAHVQLSIANNTLGGLFAAQAAAAAAAKAKDTNVTFSPVQSPTFTIDTDLTQPSGLSAAAINAFLAGSDEAGLGDAFVSAEQKYHVSARYFVAHSILESAWGSSALAQGKHNLFGYGADDANPYGDARTFASFADCIDFVAHVVEVNYLTPGGAFYHGPTLRGMNVDYASDPNWANKIAAIANDIPS